MLVEVQDEEHLKCHKCQQLFSRRNLEHDFQTKVQLLEKAEELFSRCRPREALNEFLELVKYFQHHVCPPNFNLLLIRDHILGALQMIFHFVNNSGADEKLEG